MGLGSLTLLFTFYSGFLLRKMPCVQTYDFFLS
uniref:Uncharacterized protein n=1 Tax=Rhizophora mucronata TaxID=61149 RepID=A0A2P2IVC1_RHIMU